MPPASRRGTQQPLLLTLRCRLDLWGAGLVGPISDSLEDLVGLTRVRAPPCCGTAPAQWRGRYCPLCLLRRGVPAVACRGAAPAGACAALPAPMPRCLPSPCVQLELGMNQLLGRVPDLQLPFLAELSLHSNNLSGPLPSLAKLPSLQTASLYNNQFSGAHSSALCERAAGLAWCSCRAGGHMRTAASRQAHPRLQAAACYPALAQRPRQQLASPPRRARPPSQARCRRPGRRWPTT